MANIESLHASSSVWLPFTPIVRCRDEQTKKVDQRSILRNRDQAASILVIACLRAPIVTSSSPIGDTESNETLRPICNTRVGFRGAIIFVGSVRRNHGTYRKSLSHRIDPTYAVYETYGMTTRTGTRLFAVVLSPSCPLLFLPQQ
jgi:hypothetical protein